MEKVSNVDGDFDIIEVNTESLRSSEKPRATKAIQKMADNALTGSRFTMMSKHSTIVIKQDKKK